MAACSRPFPRAFPLALLLAPLLAGLAACEQGAPEAAPAGQRAEGEVLGGSISDEMIPLERLRSQSPPLRVVPAEGGASPVASDAEGGDNSEAAPAPPEPAPAEPTADEG